MNQVADCKVSELWVVEVRILKSGHVIVVQTFNSEHRLRYSTGVIRVIFLKTV